MGSLLSESADSAFKERMEKLSQKNKKPSCGNLVPDYDGNFQSRVSKNKKEEVASISNRIQTFVGKVIGF